MTYTVSSEAILADHEESGFKARFLAFFRKLKPRAYFRRHKYKIILRTLLGVFLLVLLGPLFLVRVPAGHVGAIWRPLFGGTDTVGVLLEGVQIVLPVNVVTLYDTRLLVAHDTFDGVTADGLNVKLKITYRFRIHPSKVGLVHRTIGPNYKEKLIAPAIATVVRSEVSKFQVHDVYGPARNTIQERIFARVVDPKTHNLIESRADPEPPEGSIVLGRRHRSIAEQNKKDYYKPVIELLDVLINNIELPARVATAIEKKQEQEQLKEEYVFRLERERMESMRKEIEADGIARFQQKVQAGISPNYLKWRGIEATLSLATSENAKTVIIGGKDGMPLILNTDEATATRPKSSAKDKPKPSSKKAASTSSIDLGRSTGAPPTDNAVN
jgi:regulator of protease activity HflC (stomatin/prohibitin superfamily)